MELDGKVLGRFGKAGHVYFSAQEFSSIHTMDCRNWNVSCNVAAGRFPWRSGCRVEDSS